MTIQQAIKNVAVVVSNAMMKAGEHATLQQNIQLISVRCERADELEKKFKKELKKEKKDGKSKVSTGRNK